MQTINKWLETIGMGRYTQNFLEQGFATPRQILLLTMADIEALGVGTLEHQKKIFKAIERTRNQVISAFISCLRRQNFTNLCHFYNRAVINLF